MRWLLLLTIALVSIGLQANPNAQTVVQEASHELLDRLQGSKENRPGTAAIENLVAESVARHVDVEAFSRLVLGKHWLSSAPEQRIRFVAVFSRRIVRTYAAALRDAQVTDIHFPAPRDSGNSDRAVIPTVVELAGSPALQIGYRMYLKDGQWKIYDVMIEGISMAINYRAEFSPIINNDGVAGLIQLLETRDRQTADASWAVQPAVQ